LIQIALLLCCGTSRFASGFAAIHYPSTPSVLFIWNRRKRAFSCKNNSPSCCRTPLHPLLASPLDDFLGNIFGNNEKDDDNNNNKSRKSDIELTSSNFSEEDGDINEMSLSSFQQELAKRKEESYNENASNDDDDDNATQNNEEEEEFDGYALRDIIYAKYEQCYDVEFQRVDSYGFRTVYLNIMPFRLGKRPFRHATEMDYLCHLQAVVEILVKYNQLEYVLMQLGETKKKPRAGTSPLIAVPLRLDLTPDQVEKILG